MPKLSRGKLDEIRNAYKNGNVNELVNIVRQQSHLLNTRLYRIEKSGVGLTSSAYVFAQRETGKTKPRYTESTNKLRNMPLQELYNLALNINVKIASPTSSQSGLKHLENVRLEQSSKALARYGINVSPSELKEFFDAGGSEFLNSKYLSSDQIMEDYETYVLNGNLTVKQFLREFKRYKDQSSVKYNKVTKAWKKLNKRKK